jgi:hypothetical protein
VTTLAGNGSAGFADGPCAAARFNFGGVANVGLAIEPSTGLLLIADAANARLRALSQASATVTTFSGNGTWNLLYNGLWVRLLGLEGLFPAAYPFDAMIDDHLAYLHAYQRLTWCVPLFAGDAFSKWDWLMWTSALNFKGGQPGAFAQWTMDSFFQWANQSLPRPDGLSNPPLSDFPMCTGPEAHPAGFRARPVMGALWAPLWVTSPPPASAREQAKVRLFIAQAAAGSQ